MTSISSADKHGDKRIRYSNCLYKSHYAKIIWEAYMAVNQNTVINKRASVVNARAAIVKRVATPGLQIVPVLIAYRHELSAHGNCVTVAVAIE